MKKLFSAILALTMLSGCAIFNPDCSTFGKTGSDTVYFDFDSSVIRPDAAEVLNALMSTIEKTVAKGKKVTLVGFGTFESRKRAARTGRNPQTGAKIKIAAKTAPVFSAGKKFKEIVNKK